MNPSPWEMNLVPLEDPQMLLKTNSPALLREMQTAEEKSVKMELECQHTAVQSWTTRGTDSLLVCLQELCTMGLCYENILFGYFSHKVCGSFYSHHRKLVQKF